MKRSISDQPGGPRKAPAPHLTEDQEEGHIRRMTSRGTIAVLVSLAVFFYMIRTILLPFVLAGAVAYVATPGVDALARRSGIPRVFWAIAFLVLLVAGVSGIGYIAVPAVILDAVRVLGDLNGILTHLLSEVMGNQPVELLGQRMTATQLAAQIVTDMHASVTQDGSALLVATWGFSIVPGAILTLVILVYFLIGGRYLGAGLFNLVPPHQRPLVDRIWERTNPVLRRYFIGIAVIVVYAISASYFGLRLLGLPHAATMATMTGLLEMIPVIGPIASGLLVGLVALHHAQSVWNVLGYAVYLTLLRLSIDEVVGPIVLGRAARIPAVMVLFCFLSGGLIFGITGIIMAVPVALTVKIVLATLYDEFITATPTTANDGSGANDH